MCESLHCLGQKRGGLIVLTLCLFFLLRIDYCGLRLLSLALFLGTGNVEFKPVFHWKLHLRWLIFELPRRKKVHEQHEIYMANADPSRWGPNATYNSIGSH